MKDRAGAGAIGELLGTFDDLWGRRNLLFAHDSADADALVRVADNYIEAAKDYYGVPGQAARVGVAAGATSLFSGGGTGYVIAGTLSEGASVYGAYDLVVSYNQAAANFLDAFNQATASYSDIYYNSWASNP